MQKERVAQTIGFFALGMLAIGSALYAVNSPNRALTNGVLVLGAVLLLTYVALHHTVIFDFFRRRSSRHGANMVVMILLFTSIVIIIQALSVRHSARYDLTRNKRFSLAGQTLSVLASLEDDLRVYGFYQQGDEGRERAQDLLDQYAHKNLRVRYELIDPDRSPTRATEMGVANYGTLVVQYGDRREQIASLSEESLTNAILKLTRDVVKGIYFVRGHGEKRIDSQDPTGYSIMKEAITSQNYGVSSLSLFEEAAVPHDCYLLVVAGPTSDYFESEITKIEEYLSRGKNALFLIDARVTLPRIAELLADYRVILDNDVVIDPYSRIFGADYTVPVVTQYVEHPVTRDIDVATFYPMARSVRIAPPQDLQVTVQYLAQTGESAWGETDLDGVQKGTAVRGDDDIPAPLSLALIASRVHSDTTTTGAPRESKVLVIGDSDFASNSAFRISGNADFLLNMINFLAEEKDLVAIRPKEGLGDRLFLTASEGRFIFLVSVVVLPLSVIGVGVSVFVRRRKSG